MSPLEGLETQDGTSLASLAALGPLLVVCLPGGGAAASRAWLADLAAARHQIETLGTRIAIVHPGAEPPELPEVLRYVARVADPQRRLYAHFGLAVSAPRIFRPSVQLPGVVLVRGGEVLKAHRPRTPRDRPVLLDLARTA